MRIVRDPASRGVWLSLVSRVGMPQVVYVWGEIRVGWVLPDTLRMMCGVCGSPPGVGCRRVVVGNALVILRSM